MTTHINATMTEEELIKALQEALQSIDVENEPGTITTKEFAAATGMTRRAAIDELRSLAKRDVVKPDYVLRTDDWGDSRHIKGWRYVGKAA